MLFRQFVDSEDQSGLQDCFERMVLTTKKAASAANAGHAGILMMVRSSLSFTMSKEKEFNLLKKSCLCRVNMDRLPNPWYT
jgi:hypothetical protein